MEEKPLIMHVWLMDGRCFFCDLKENESPEEFVRRIVIAGFWGVVEGVKTWYPVTEILKITAR